MHFGEPEKQQSRPCRKKSEADLHSFPLPNSGKPDKGEKNLVWRIFYIPLRLVVVTYFDTTNSRNTFHSNRYR